MKLLILQGPPACGKSTYRKQMIADNPTTWGYVNLDELREHNPLLQERQVQELQKQCVEHLRNAGKNIIIDNTNLNPRTVQNWESWARDNHYDCEIIRFDQVPWQEAIKRDALRPVPVGRSVVIQMFMDAGLFPGFASKPDTLIFDLDGSICDISARRKYVEGDGKKDWVRFFAEICNDVPNPSLKYIYDLVTKHDSQTIVIFMSGRPSDYRAATEEWLHRHGFNEYFALFMRPFNNKDDDAVVKEQLYRKYVEPYFNTRIVFDDRNRVVDMWRRINVPCFQVAPGNF